MTRAASTQAGGDYENASELLKPKLGAYLGAGLPPDRPLVLARLSTPRKFERRVSSIIR